jgi:hypothetical protein
MRPSTVAAVGFLSEKQLTFCTCDTPLIQQQCGLYPCNNLGSSAMLLQVYNTTQAGLPGFLEVCGNLYQP